MKSDTNVLLYKSGVFATSTGSIFASIRQSVDIMISLTDFSNICMKQTLMTSIPGYR
jgi:hypothetical protein